MKTAELAVKKRTVEKWLFNLIEKHSLLKSTAMHQAAEICLNEIAQGVTRRNAAIAIGEEELRQVLARIDSQSQWLENRIHNGQQKIEVFINTFVKEEFFREIEGFGTALREQLPDEIMPIEDVNQIRRHLPGYLEAVWAEFFNTQLPEIKSKLISEMKLVEKTVKDDLQELLGDSAVNFKDWLSDFDSTPDNMRNFISPKRGKNYSGTVASLIQVVGFASLFANPLGGLVFLGAGQVVRLLGKKAAEISDKRAIAESAVEAVKELEKQIKQQVEVKFAEITEQLKAATADLYNQGINQIRSFVEESISSHQELIAKKTELEKLLNQTIPELRQVLSELG